MKYYFVYRKNGRVLSFSEERPNYDNKVHKVKSFYLSDKELKEVKEARKITIEKNKLVKTQHGKQVEPEVQALIDKAKVNEATIPELNELVTYLLSLHDII